MSNRGTALAGVVALAVAAAGMVVWRNLGDRDERAGGTARLQGRSLGPGARELIALLEKGAHATYHARYTATPSEGGGPHEMWLEIWRKPPREREDSVVVEGDRTTRSAAFFLPRDAALCTERGAGSWSCGALSPTERRGPRSLIDATIESIGIATVEESRSETIAGQRARCFAIPVQGQAGQMCVTHGGVLARLSAGGTRIELVELESDVSDRVFRLPARVEAR